jgi:hypothetical protein
LGILVEVFSLRTSQSFTVVSSPAVAMVKPLGWRLINRDICKWIHNFFKQIKTVNLSLSPNSIDLFLTQHLIKSDFSLSS